MPEADVTSELNGTIWKIERAPGDKVSEGDTLLVIESMKMEIPVLSPCDGTVSAILVTEGQAVNEGEVLAKVGG